jgi:hypothetical protein
MSSNVNEPTTQQKIIGGIVAAIIVVFMVSSVSGGDDSSSSFDTDYTSVTNSDGSETSRVSNFGHTTTCTTQPNGDQHCETR